MLVFLTQEFFDFRHFILRQQLTVDGIEAELARDLVCHALRIAGQHDGFSDAIPVQSLDGLGRMFLDDIRDYDVAGVFPIDSHMDNRAGLFARMPGRTDILHHFSLPTQMTLPLTCARTPRPAISSTSSTLQSSVSCL